MTSYEEVTDLFKENDCKLITKKEEYESFKGDKHACVLKFIASCTHYNTVTLTNFKYKRSGLICKECMCKKVSNKLKQKNKGLDESIHQEQEYLGVQMLTKVISDEFEVAKTNEGCVADMLIKPRYEPSDKWCLIQIKTTKQLCHDLYTFSFQKKDYQNCCIICICIDENKKWIIDNSMVIGKSKLNIGKTIRSEFHRYMVTDDQVIEHLHRWYSQNPRYRFTYGMQPKSPNQQIEQQFRSFRGRSIPYLQYVYPVVDGRKTDFKVNEFKVQEKVASRQKDKVWGYIVHLHRSSRCAQHKCYNKGDNDFYWVWLVDDLSMFFIFPEAVLVDRCYVQKDGNLNDERQSIFISQNNWTRDYRFYLGDTHLEQKLKSLFE